jgi:hypothetical protein
MQRSFFAEMRDHIRSLGYGGPISASNWRTANDSLLRDVEYFTYTETDVIDLHNYFAPADISLETFRLNIGDVYRNVSAIDRPHEISVAMKQVAGRVSMVSEFSWVNPTDLQAESPLIATAYSSLQGLDALFWFHHGSMGFDTVLRKWQVGGPAVMGQFPGTNLLYRRGDVVEAPVVVREGRSEDSLMALESAIIVQGSGFDPTRDSVYDPEQGSGKLGMQAALVGKVELAFGDSDQDFVHPELAARMGDVSGRITSITDEVELAAGPGVVTVNTPRSQGATGYLQNAGEIALADVTIRMHNAFGAVLAISLDGLPLAQSGKVLIQAATVEKPYRFATQPATILSQPAQRITDLGTVPFNMQLIDGEVQMAGFSGASATYLDANGYSLDSPVHYDVGDDLVVRLPFNALYTVVTREVAGGTAPVVFTRETGSAVTGVPYRARLAGFSQRGALQWSLLSGQLPAGIVLAADGTLSGHTFAAAGDYAFRVMASDGTGSTEADVSLRVIGIETRLMLQAGQWQSIDGIGAVYGSSTYWGYSPNHGFLFTGHAPWLYHPASDSWLAPVASPNAQTNLYYHADWGWLIQRVGESTFFRFVDGAWVDADLPDAP